MMAKIESVRELEAYKMAFEAAMRIFRLTKNFPGILSIIRGRGEPSVVAQVNNPWEGRALRGRPGRAQRHRPYVLRRYLPRRRTVFADRSDTQGVAICMHQFV